LQDTVRAVMDLAMAGKLAEAAAEDRLLLIGTTNLDIGAGRVFDLGREARQALEQENADRLGSILLASSAIPGVFPPLEIDGMLYVDGGATTNLFIAAFPGPDGVLSRFLDRNPQAPKPRVRIWIVVNQRLTPAHAVTQPKWVQISERALGTLTSTSQLFALMLVRDLVHEARVERGVDAELRLVSIPADAPAKTSDEMFDREYMRALQEFGHEMGADPSSWVDEIPTAFRGE
jgi:predicted acylesterase/phospholipase RssA